MRFFLPLLFVVCGACRSLHERQVGPVAIRAETALLADRTAAIVAESLPRFPVPHEQAVTIVVRTGSDGEVNGEAFTLDAIVWVAPEYAERAETGPDFLAYVVVHELLHLYIRPGERARLPAVLEEGLVDRRTLAVRPDVRTWRRATSAIALLRALGVRSVSSEPDADGARTSFLFADAPELRLPPLAEAFAIRRADFGDLSSRETELLTALGWFLWERAGEEALPGLLARVETERAGRVQAQWMCAAAQLDPGDYAAWVPAIESLIGPEELRLIDESLSRARRGRGQR